VLKWEFMTDDYDIAFGVYYKPPSGGREPLVPVKRVNCHTMPDDGCFTCERLGTYEICFDNSYSWTRNKNVYYIVELLESDVTTKEEVDQVSSGGSWVRLEENLITTKL